MEKIHWILEEDTFSEGNLDILVKAIKQFEGDTTLVKYIPFSTGAYVRSGNREDHLHQIYQEKKGVPTLIHGSVNLLQKVAHYSPVYPGSISVTWDNYNCSR